MKTFQNFDFFFLKKVNFRCNLTFFGHFFALSKSSWKLPLSLDVPEGRPREAARRGQKRVWRNSTKQCFLPLKIKIKKKIIKKYPNLSQFLIACPELNHFFLCPVRARLWLKKCAEIRWRPGKYLFYKWTRILITKHGYSWHVVGMN